MLRNLTWQAFDTFARAQLAMFHALSDRISLTEEDRRCVLGLDDHAWEAWAGVLSNGQLPDEPPLPEMLRRIAETTFNLSVLAEQRGIPV
jgi:hypothetical protein